MIRPLLIAAFAGLALVGPAALPAAPLKPGEVEVRILTTDGPILVAVDTRHAPITARNFLAYVDQHRFDGMSFYRAARATGNPKTGFVEGGVHNRLNRLLPPIAHEPTTKTGLRHVDGTLSMARDKPGTASGDFFIVVGPGHYLDATRTDPGYAAFGHVVAGMDVVKRMLAARTFPGGWTKAMVGQSIMQPIRIVSARRVP